MKQIILAFGSLVIVALIFISLRSLHIKKLSFQRSVEGASTSIYEGEAVIKITNTGFIPNYVNVKAGTEVVFINSMQNPIAIRLGNQNIKINPLSNYSKNFDAAGNFDYILSLNLSQKVRINVK